MPLILVRRDSIIYDSLWRSVNVFTEGGFGH